MAYAYQGPLFSPTETRAVLHGRAARLRLPPLVRLCAGSPTCSWTDCYSAAFTSNHASTAIRVSDQEGKIVWLTG